jgi:NAD(P)H-flavin reductase
VGRRRGRHSGPCSIARALQGQGTPLTIVVGARSEAWVLLADELAALGELVICTDDGSRGRSGLVTAALADVLGRIRSAWSTRPGRCS